MISSIVSRLVILVFGTLYPAYASYKAVRTKNVREYVKWMMYWIVFALFSCAETFTDVFLSFWFPFYYEIKILLVLWLLSPATKGSSILYRKFVHPMLSRREQDIDEYIAKAKEQGYHTVLHLGTKGVNYATTVIMQTAIKGGGGLVQQLRRSYSLGDLSSDVDGDSSNGRKALPDAQDRNRDRERVISDGRHHRPRGHSPRRSASGSGRVEMYFPEVDVDVRGPSVREPSVPLSHIRSSEDVSSGYSSAEPLYQQGGSVGAGQRGDGHHDSLASSREPLVRTASVGGSSRSARTRSSRGGGGTTGKKSSAAGVPEATEESSLGGEDSPHFISPSPPNLRSRSNSLPISPDLRPELIALLQALNAELEHGISMSKLAEAKTMAESMENAERRIDVEQESTEISGVSNFLAESGRVSEKSKISVSSKSFSESSGINSSIGCDDIFYDSMCMSPIPISKDCQIFNEDEGCSEIFSEAMTEPENVIVTSTKGPVSCESLLVPISLLSSEMCPHLSEEYEADEKNEISGGIKNEALEFHSDTQIELKKSVAESIEKAETTSSETMSMFFKEGLTAALPEMDLHKNKTCASDNEGIDKSENSLQPHEPSDTLHVNRLDHHIDKDQASTDNISHEDCMMGGNLNTKLDNDDIVSEHNLLQSKNKTLSPDDLMIREEETEEKIVSSFDDIVITENNNEKKVSSSDKIVHELKLEEKILSSNRMVASEKSEAVSDEAECKTDSTEENLSENNSRHNQLNLPSESATSTDSTHLLETTSLKHNEPNESHAVKDVLIINASASDSQTSINQNFSGNLDANQEPKKDIRSGRYHKLQAPEPPPRARRSSSKSSTSEEGEIKSVHRSRSPRKSADSPVAKLHDQIENLAAMLPFWKSAKRSHGKEDGEAGEGFRIREMSRSPSRRAGGQAPL